LTKAYLFEQLLFWIDGIPGVEELRDETIQGQGGPAVNYPSDRKSPVWPRPASLVVFALLIGAFAISCSGASGEQRAESPAGGDSQAAVDLEHPSLGDEGAPVVLTEYADYQ
jgi:hypothetical protein